MSLSGCRTGQRRHVSHTVPSQLASRSASFLPSLCPLSAGGEGRGGQGAWDLAAYAERTFVCAVGAKFTDAEKKEQKKKCPLNFQDDFFKN